MRQTSPVNSPGQLLVADCSMVNWSHSTGTAATAKARTMSNTDTFMAAYIYVAIYRVYEYICTYVRKLTQVQRSSLRDVTSVRTECNGVGLPYVD